jgi:PAS domain S-box-containing protein
LWPHAAGAPFGVAYRRAVAENVPVVVEAYYPEPLDAWFDVRGYPSPEGLALFFTDTSERRRREEQLRLLETAALQTSDGILIVKVSGPEAKSGPVAKPRPDAPGEDDDCEHPVLVNSAFERITGFNLDDLRHGYLRLPRASWLHPDSGGPPQAQAGLDSTELEQVIRRKDGSEFWAEFTLTPLEDRDGSTSHWVWTLRDITERKRTEETSRLFTAIVEDSDDAIFSKDLAGIVLTWNKGAERIHGYSSNEMVGQSVARMMPADRADELAEILDDLRRGARRVHFETERVRKDGKCIDVSLTVSPIRNSSGQVVGASVISRDITERKLAENALALSEERYRSLALATTQIVWTTGFDGGVVEDIPMWREFTGQGLEEMKGMGWIDALHPEDRERISEVWSSAVRNRSFYDTEFRLRRYDGEYRWMAVHGVPVLEGGGVIREWVATGADIQDRKQAEEEIRKLNEDLEQRVLDRTVELQAANRELEAFAFSVSHDLRTPLRAIDGFSRILLEDYASELPLDAQHYLKTARHSALQMSELIDDLLAFSRLSRQPLQKQPIAPAELVRQVLDELRHDREGRKVEITVGDLPACEGDPQLLKQALVNLLSNGLKYTRTREVARIEVGALAAAHGSTPVYYVRDNGVGFDMRYADKLFGVFQRLHGAREYPGTGVGLAIVQRIVHRHGGQVWAEAAVNQGATFYFMLAQGAPHLAKEELKKCLSN